MNPAELTFGAGAVAVLVTLAGFFAWRQVKTLRSLGAGSALSPEDRLYVRAQAYRRLLCSVLLLLLAGLLAGSFFLEGPLQQVHEERLAQTAQDRSAPVQPEHQMFLEQFTVYWIAILLVLLLLLGLVAADFLAIARFGQRHRRQLRTDLQATLASELARLRNQGNGQH